MRLEDKVLLHDKTDYLVEEAGSSFVSSSC